MIRNSLFKSLALGALLALAAAPQASAQMDPNAGPAQGDRPSMRGDMNRMPDQGAAPMERRMRPTAPQARGDRGYQVPADLVELVRPRMGPAQRQLELVQTTLLNQFASLGYTNMRDFRREGERYVAQVQNRQGNWVNVSLDPVTGEITTQQ